MDPIHVDFLYLHILLSHFPVIGTMVAVGLYLCSFFAHTATLRWTSLVLFVAMALLTIPTFVSGAGAQAQFPDAPEALVLRHLGAAQLTIWFIVITGVLAAMGLWQTARAAQASRWNVLAVLFFSLVTVSLLARTANTGGEIGHAQLRVPEASAVDAVMRHFEPSPVAFTNLMVANKYWWAFMMFVHLIGLTSLVATIGLLNLRVLGFVKQLPIGPLNKLVPWGLAGLGLNVITGMLAFIGMSAYYAFNVAFALKIGFLLAAVATLMLFYATSAFSDCENVGPGEDAPLRAKIISGASLGLWLAVIVFGRYIQSFEDSISFMR